MIRAQRGRGGDFFGIADHNAFHNLVPIDYF